ncbi:MAG: DinB family protein [Bacteroidetes bacterium]|nr:DinB family protein [Bacteroidota bacterium]
MALNTMMLNEYNQESLLTRKMLERVPFDNPTWKPHEKSMTIQRLSSHVAEIPVWMLRILDADRFDFMVLTQREKYHAKDSAELLQKFADISAQANAALQNATDEQLLANWSGCRGEQIIFTVPRIVAIRNWVFNHTIHHRGQLSVYLRLNNIPVPGMYGPSADER